MDELVFLKLGGSIITDKSRPYTARFDKLAELADEISSTLTARPQLRLVLGHGSGSFGHYAAKEHLAPFPYSTAQTNGRRSQNKEYWRGFAEVWYRASQLNRHVMEALHAAKVSAISVAPSASAKAADGMIIDWDLAPLMSALAAGLVPVIYGDIVFDASRGAAVLSTEVLMCYLAHHIAPHRILLAGLESGVWDDFPARQQRLEKVTPAMYEGMLNKIGGSQGTDVTGGMKSKVEQMLQLTTEIPEVSVQIFSGEEKGNLRRVLAGEQLGTLIST
jgi:isopentenyl phosphate kinase